MLKKCSPFVVGKRTVTDEDDEASSRAIKYNVMWRLVRNAFSRIIRLKEKLSYYYYMLYNGFSFFLDSRHAFTAALFYRFRRDKPVSVFIPVDRAENRRIASPRRTHRKEITSVHRRLQARNVFPNLTKTQYY